MKKNTKKLPSKTNHTSSNHTSSNQRHHKSALHAQSSAHSFLAQNTPVAKNTPTMSNPQDMDAHEPIANFAQVNYIRIGAQQEGQRVDNFLLARLKGLPRSHVYKMIRDGEIRINKKRCKAHERLAIGDVVRIAPVRLSVKDKPVVSDEMADVLLACVLAEDDGLIVLNKPFGLAVHGGSGVSYGVIEAMRIATGKKYLELVHRIDKHTSGLLLIAKKRSTLKQLQDAFRDKSIQKSYVCLTLGHIQQDELVIDKPLAKFTLPSGERRVRIDDAGKASITKITVLVRAMLDGIPISIVLAKPITGRTHQIRVHLADIGHALLGDDKYQKKSLPSVKRLMLHAYHMRIHERCFIAPIAQDMAQIIAQVTDWQSFGRILDEVMIR